MSTSQYSFPTVSSVDEEEVETEIISHEASKGNNCEVLNLCHDVFSGDKNQEDVFPSGEDASNK